MAARTEEPQHAQRGSQRWDLALWAALVLASMASVASLWTVDYLPTNDGPQHLLAAHIEAHYGDPGTVYADLLALEPQFAGRGFSMVFLPLQAVLPWKVALRVALSLITAAWGWGFAAFVLAVDDRRRFLAVVGMLVPLRWSLYMGFFPFFMASACGWFVLAFTLRSSTSSRLRWAGLALMLLLQSIMHVFAAMLTWPLVAVLCAARAEPARRWRELGWGLVVGAPAFAIFALTYATRASLLTVRFSETTAWVPLAERPAAFLSWLAPGPLWRGLAVAAILLACLASAFARARRARDVRLTALAVASVVFCAAALFAPVHIRGWQFFCQRFVDGALVLGVASVALPIGIARSRVAGAALVAVALGSAAASANVHRALSNACADALSGLERSIQRRGLVLPLVLSASCDETAALPVPELEPLRHAGALYSVAHGGLQPYLASGTPSVHAISVRKEAWAKMPYAPDVSHWAVVASDAFRNDAARRRHVLTELAAFGMAFESIVVFGARPSDIALFTSRGFSEEWSRGRLFIGSYRACGTEVILPAREVGSPPVLVSYGLVPIDAPFDEVRLDGPRGVAPPEAPPILSIPLSGGLCGEVWVRAVWDEDRSGGLSPGDRTCRGADDAGRLRANVTRDRPRIECEPK
jgi:hypothetical protein